MARNIRYLGKRSAIMPSWPFSRAAAASLASIASLFTSAHCQAPPPHGGHSSSSAAPIGKSFGNGVAGFPLCAEPVTLVNHTLSEGATHGVLHHFWSTGGAIKVDRLWVEYFLDGETTPSISYQPSMMCGLASSFLPEFNKIGHTDLYHAGAMCGRNSAVGGYFNTFPIPFQKHALVTVRADPQDCKSGCCGGGYLNVRGTENLPVVLPGSGIPLPITARLHLQKNDWQVAQPAEHVPIINVTSGNGLLFMVTWSVESQPVGGDKAGGGYIEGCWQFYPTGDTPYPGFVVGTGVEDYFDSSYYFGADAGIFGPTHQIKDLMFRTDLSGLTYFQRENGTERISAYRFHNQDPLAFSGGGKLLWWVGQCKPFNEQQQGMAAAAAEVGSTINGAGTTKCGNPYPDHPLPPPPPPPVPPQLPALAGCASGQCDAFCHLDNVRGCSASWGAASSLRAKKTSPAPAKPCGGTYAISPSRKIILLVYSDCVSTCWRDIAEAAGFTIRF